ncbi:hypothetical protein D3C86_1767710 [compost metagenome]
MRGFDIDVFFFINRNNGQDHDQSGKHTKAPDGILQSQAAVGYSEHILYQVSIIVAQCGQHHAKNKSCLLESREFYFLFSTMRKLGQ